MNKDETRKLALSERKLRFSKDKFNIDNNKLFDLIRPLLQSYVLKNSLVAIYKPFKYEFDLTFLKNYYNVCYPKTSWLDMDFYTNVTKFEKSKFSVLEPIDGVKVNKEDISVMFVPALSVNKKNYRIGYGKGYYDRYLENSNIFTISIVFSDFVFDFKEEDHDVKINEVILWRTQQ